MKQTKEDYDEFRHKLEVNSNAKTYIEAKAYKDKIESMTLDLKVMNSEARKQNKVAMELKRKYLDEWNRYIDLHDKEDEIRKNIMSFVLGSLSEPEDATEE